MQTHKQGIFLKKYFYNFSSGNPTSKSLKKLSAFSTGILVGCCPPCVLYENRLRKSLSHCSFAWQANFMGTMSHMAYVLPPHGCRSSKAWSQSSDSALTQETGSQEDAPSPNLTLYFTLLSLSPCSHYLFDFSSFTGISFSETTV